MKDNPLLRHYKVLPPVKVWKAHLQNILGLNVGTLIFEPIKGYYLWNCRELLNEFPKCVLSCTLLIAYLKTRTCEVVYSV